VTYLSALYIKYKSIIILVMNLLVLFDCSIVQKLINIHAHLCFLCNRKYLFNLFFIIRIDLNPFCVMLKNRESSGNCMSEITLLLVKFLKRVKILFVTLRYPYLTNYIYLILKHLTFHIGYCDNTARN
jgi:hypothetical protein